MADDLFEYLDWESLDEIVVKQSSACFLNYGRHCGVGDFCCWFCVSSLKLLMLLLLFGDEKRFRCLFVWKEGGSDSALR